jgi:cysteine desulfurase/selenocysteine lyase
VVVKPDEEGHLDPSDFEREVDGKTKLVRSATSNVLGTIAPIKEISASARRETVLLVDGAQSVPHMPVDVKGLGCDFLCFSGHKMLGPTGTGVLWVKNEENLEPLMVGGGMVEDVSLNASEMKNGYERKKGYEMKEGYEGFEAGTPDISGGIGLGAAADYLKRAGIEEVALHEKKLASKLLKGLQEIKGVEIYGPKDVNGRGGVVSFNVLGLLPREVALMLDQASDISVRSGHHCCIPLMSTWG